MKSIICAAVLAAATASVQAQDKKFQFGAKAGANLSTVTGDYEDAEPLAGAHVGVFAEYRINGNFSVQPELVFSMQGAKSDAAEDVFGTIYTNEWIKLNYLNLPVLAKYHFSRVKGLSVGAGPQIGLLLSAKQKYYTDVEGVHQEHEDDVKDNLKSIDLGIAAGVEYELPMHVFFSLRANVGLLDINDGGSDKAYNSALQLSAGYRF